MYLVKRPKFTGFYFIFAMLVLTSCAKQTLSPQIISDSTEVKSQQGIQIVDSLKAVEPEKSSLVEPVTDSKNISDELSFTYLKAKSKVSWKSDKNTDNYTVDIRAKKDSIIWMNISVSMISGANGLFTKEKVQFYDKINDKYLSWSYDSLSTMLGFKVDFGIIQSLIIGNEPFKKNNSRVIRENENFIIQQEEGKVKIDNFVGPNRKLKKLLMKEDASENKMQLDFEDFSQINQSLFPFSSQITLDVKNKENELKKTIISIKYSKVELLETPLAFPFKVPEKYLKNK